LWPLCHFLERQSYSAAVKTACALVGDATGPVRAPLLALDDDASAELARLLEHAAATLGKAALRHQRSPPRSGHLRITSAAWTRRRRRPADDIGRALRLSDVAPPRALLLSA
jgi:hypothetical protein